MPLIDELLSVGALRRGIWKLWYPYLTRRLRRDDVLFLNYAFEDDCVAGPKLGPSDEPNRGCIQLYHHVGMQAELGGKRILEVSCGHGGGASYLSRTLRPSAYVGLDLNATGIAFCRERHKVEDLTFVQGDAESLPFADASFDVVVNVEASHCYPSMPRFLAEVARVLRSGGDFLYADFRFFSGLAAWEDELASAPLGRAKIQVIDRQVLRGMDRNSARSAALIERHLPRFLHSIGRDFAGVKDSRIYCALAQQKMSYRSYHFQKT
jgi:ubiquinone/menaquinone biosynthesis C-methylase UbiE